MIQKPAEPRYPSVNLITQKSRRQRVNAAPRWSVVIFAAVALVAWWRRPWPSRYCWAGTRRRGC